MLPAIYGASIMHQRAGGRLPTATTTAAPDRILVATEGTNSSNTATAHSLSSSAAAVSINVNVVFFGQHSTVVHRQDADASGRARQLLVKRRRKPKRETRSRNGGARRVIPVGNARAVRILRATNSISDHESGAITHRWDRSPGRRLEMGGRLSAGRVRRRQH